ncbi:S-norcoclaurine synthase 1-like [Iris pallida]|uniref:S-norcoclaurine synthase 1-like n=1 Tax=Iris pallida TaxID=29817 RepID=A0AAX6DGB3_IRIPA|nr:S-norcoclaurine synthase 1-like [Iris pallida]KAJ6806235.1 S-norcoclaurine synthase 1-like [Iris pallida]KAJ6841395.1 S-norcoclaurine synthase 1-like [Iris pallida]
MQQNCRRSADPSSMRSLITTHRRTPTDIGPTPRLPPMTPWFRLSYATTTK